MTLFFGIVRVMAVMAGVCLFVASVANIAGVVPHSNDAPTLAARTSKALKLCVVAVTLVLPYRKLRSAARDVGALGIGVSVFWALTIGFVGVAGYLRGEKSWHVVPVALLVVGLILANALAFVRITKTQHVRMNSDLS